MSYAHAAGAYREREILTASPAKLVVIVFDHLLVNLRRAKLAHEAGNVEARVEAVCKAREAVMELLASTDVERGGEIAQNLRALYVFLFNELLVMGHSPDALRLQKIAETVMNLREAFAAIAANPVAESPAA
jgi:flagellar protein FliS